MHVWFNMAKYPVCHFHRQVQEKFRAKDMKVYYVLVDREKAFDRVPGNGQVVYKESRRGIMVV